MGILSTPTCQNDALQCLQICCWRTHRNAACIWSACTMYHTLIYPDLKIITWKYNSFCGIGFNNNNSHLLFIQIQWQILCQLFDPTHYSFRSIEKRNENISKTFIAFYSLKYGDDSYSQSWYICIRFILMLFL